MRTILLALAVLLAAFVTSQPVRAADSASVHAILITASNTKGGVDPRLAPYEAELKRNLPFSTFRYAGEGSTAVTAAGRASIALAGGHRLELEGGRGGAAGIQLKVQWLNGKKVVINTSLTLKAGVPAVLGRRGGDDGEVPVILLIAK